jgi:hypothetical protein
MFSIVAIFRIRYRMIPSYIVSALCWRGFYRRYLWLYRCLAPGPAEALTQTSETAPPDTGLCPDLILQHLLHDPVSMG